MKALCITGTNNATLKNIATPFYNAGMQAPKALEREQTIDFSRWHSMASAPLKAGKPLGKIWENLATDLILANLENDCWGWYEENSIAALDFWAELEPNIHFLLVCTRPDVELEQKVAEANSTLNAEQWLQEWHNRHRKMLDFYLKNADRCLLIDATSALQHLNGQLKLAHQQWQLPLNAETLTATIEPEDNNKAAVNTKEQNNRIASWIARELIKNSPENIAGFYTELRAAQYPFSGGQDNQLVDWLNAQLDSTELQNLLQSYQTLYKQATNKEQLLALQHEKSTTEQTLDEVKEENELLLLQLHQVQEELESTFLNKQALEQEVQKAGQQVQELRAKLTATEASDQQHKSWAHNLKKQLEQAKQSTNNPQELEEAKQENELLLLQLHQVQEELEHYFLQHQEACKKQEQLAADNRRIKQQLHQAEQLVANKPAGLLKKLRRKQPKSQLKYDGVHLQNEQVNPDYEHIWIKLKNPSFGNQLAEEWSFRLSCAGVRPGDFGKQPKLELPEQQEQLLQHWFAESESDHGRKLELRFALSNSMDANVWKQLQGQDKQLVRSLVEQLPNMLNELQQQGRRLSRSWEDWHKLAADMQRILAGKKDKK